jgi:Glycosyl transferase family 11
LISAQLKGGLGNQLFQIAATLALAYRNGDSAGFDFDQHLQLTQGESAAVYRSTIFRHLHSSNLSGSYQFFEQFNSDYTNIPYRPELVLRGYFHGIKHFQDFEQQVKKTLELDPKLLAQVKQKYQIEGQSSCAIHVRRGDYINNPHGLKVLADRYYQAAISLLPHNTVLVVCSDDVDCCRQLFQGSNFKFSREVSVLDDFYLMAACDRQIIANSTFSWWASYLSPTIIPAIAPRQWLQDQKLAGFLPIQDSPHLQLIAI